jgi:hypothetical protein
MTSRMALQLLLFRHPDDTDVTRFEDAILQAFQGGKQGGHYFSTGDDLGIQCQAFSGTPPVSPDQILGQTSHTLAVVLVDRALLDKTDESFWDWVSAFWSFIDSSGGQHGIMVVPMEERLGHAFGRRRKELQTVQVCDLHEFGEWAIRPAILALRLIHEARILLTDALPASHDHKSGHLRLFISHAKMDGLPLAHALRHQIKELKWLKDFYDVDDLPPGRNWEKELEKGVGSSLIIILRTDVYDNRPWCQQEVYWADEYATPAVLVEARTALNHPSGLLPLERVPSVRIPDGNLIRIVFLALREGLRFLLFLRLIEQMKKDGFLPDAHLIRVFSYPPSMPALLRACKWMSQAKSPAGTQKFIVYPDPPLRAGIYEAAHALVQAYAPKGTELVTPNTLIVMTGGSK